MKDLPEEEVNVCIRYNTEIVFGVGGFNMPQSSSWLIAHALRKTSTVTNNSLPS